MLRTHIHQDGSGGVWNPGCTWSPANPPPSSPNTLPALPQLSKLDKGTAQETEEMNSRNLVFQHPRSWSPGQEIPSCLFKWLQCFWDMTALCLLLICSHSLIHPLRGSEHLLCAGPGATGAPELCSCASPPHPVIKTTCPLFQGTHHPIMPLPLTCLNPHQTVTLTGRD